MLALSLVLLAGCGSGDTVSPGNTIGGGDPPEQRPEPPPPTIGRVYQGFDDSHPNLQLATYVAASGAEVRSVLVSGRIESGLTLVAGVTYVLNGTVSVGGDGIAPVTLTIQPGATIYGQGRDARLLVDSASSIRAEGKADAPIILSSIGSLERDSGVSVLDPESGGEWGGVRIGGQEQQSGGVVLRYLRIEHAGLMASSALALNGAGTEASISHLHIHASGSAGVSLEGGNAHVSYLVVSDPAGDGIVWSDGFSGSGQHLLIVRDVEGVSLRGSGEATPRFANLSLIGAGSGNGLALSGSGSAVVLNSVIAGFDYGLRLADRSAVDAVISGRGRIGSSLFDNGEELAASADDARVRTALAAEGVVFASPLASTLYIPGPLTEDDFPTSLAAYAPLRTTAYVGAFSGSDSVRDNWTAGWTRSGAVLAGTASCPERTRQAGGLAGKVVCALSGRIESDLTLGQGDRIIYHLEGQVFVGSDGGPEAFNRAGSVQASLSIEPGVTIYGEGISDGLVVTRGSRILSNGTRDKPVRFTSGPALRGEVGAETRAQWLGLSINGKAPINKCDVVEDAEGGSALCQDDGEGSSGIYGGDVATDSSGALLYTRVEYAGIFFTEEDQSNGISFQGVGSGTRVSHVQVHNNGDDGMEFFGGTVSARYVVITGAGDDSIDWTDGWRGNIQFLIVEQSGGSDFAFEGDNRSVSAPHSTPRSAPGIANFTVIGDGAGSRGMRLREGTGGDFVNGIIEGVSPAIDIDDASNDLLLSPPVAPDGARLRIASVLVDAETVIDPDDDNAQDVASAISGLSVTTSDLNGFSFFGRRDTGVVPGADAHDATSSPDDDFFVDAQYLGAVRNIDDTWYLGWTIDGNGNITGSEQ